MSKYLTEQLKVNLKFFSEFRPVIPSHFPRILHYSTLIYQKNRVKLDHNRWQTKELMKLSTRLVRGFVPLRRFFSLFFDNFIYKKLDLQLNLYVNFTNL